MKALACFSPKAGIEKFHVKDLGETVSFWWQYLELPASSWLEEKLLPGHMAVLAGFSTFSSVQTNDTCCLCSQMVVNIETNMQGHHIPPPVSCSVPQEGVPRVALSRWRKDIHKGRDAKKWESYDSELVHCIVTVKRLECLFPSLNNPGPRCLSANHSVTEHSLKKSRSSAQCQRPGNISSSQRRAAPCEVSEWGHHLNCCSS